VVANYKQRALNTEPDRTYVRGLQGNVGDRYAIVRLANIYYTRKGEKLRAREPGYGQHAQGMELDAIAAVVIGGTVLTGGSGFVFGTVLGVLVLGLIQTLITFQGTLSSWWTKIFIGALLFAFIVLQRAVNRRAT